LEDIRVLDFTHALNGPFCTMLLGQLGAEIIKVELPGGDDFRHTWMPPGSSEDGYGFLAVNTNKRSVVLNLRTAGGQDLARRLIAVSDVLVENDAQGTMETFGLGYDALTALNPRLIYACVRGSDEAGPYARYGSLASVEHGMGTADELAGVSLAVGILAAITARDQTGEGQRIDVVTPDALLGFGVMEMHSHFSGRFAAYKVGSERGPTQVADGEFTLRAPEISDENYRRLALTMGREDLVDDPRFALAPDRRKNLKVLDEIVLEWAQGQRRQELWDKLRNLGYFGAPLLSLAEVLEDPHIQARQAFVQREHPVAGEITLLVPWIRMSETPAAIRRVAPTLGQHTDEVLRGVLGLSQSEIDQLRAQAVIG
jgi:crotonobetainyl-CoA:carnitine CoA-transferase CaiB-like acyl-CoA transferase